jgi:cytoskeletal protein RodZ
MPSFGEKLRQERESRDTTLQEIAGTTKIKLAYLEALEQNEFEALPGQAFGKFYIRAYAEVLGFDPGPLIDDYDRERRSREPADPPTDQRAKREMAERAERARARRAAITRTREPEEETETGMESAEPAEAEEEDRAEANQKEAAAQPQHEAVAPEPFPAAFAPEAASRRTVVTLVLLAAALLIVGTLLYFAFFGGGDAQGEPPAAVVSGEGETTSVNDTGVETATTGRGSIEEPRTTPPIEASGTAPPQGPVTVAPTSPGRLTISEFGVGRRIVNRRLEGRGDRFEEGGVVWFSTRVLGGEPGELIRHDWFHQGDLMQSVELELGGPHWRTHSRKTLQGVGEWMVEARDSEDRILARAAFDCVPPDS